MLTKLTKEIERLVVTAEPKIEASIPIEDNTVYKQLQGKIKLFSNLNGGIITLCREEDTEQEIKDLKSITAKN